MKHPKFFRAFEVVAELPPALRDLKRIASNFWWSWSHEARDLFRSVHRDEWDGGGHNPVALLNSVGPERLARLAEDPSFLHRLGAVVAAFDAYMAAPRWFEREHAEAVGRTIAYFCFEFGISEGLPIYSGGLGVLAGDHLKAASDLGVPLVGVGLLYNRGYFRQRLTHDGWQLERYPDYDFYQMPISLVRDEAGDPRRVSVDFPDRTVTCQIWRADVGRVPLYLLDSNVLENAPNDQSITDSLYSGDEEMRIRQEMILGIGGMRALEALGIRPSVCHMNEGHAAFLALERIRQFMREKGCDFRTARQATVGGNVFTTHTPVPAGFDLFSPAILERYLGRTASDAGLSFGEFARLGRVASDSDERFNMAILAMETSNRVNGVSELHAQVSRGMFSRRWPELPEEEVPIEAITNGIHTSTWTGRRMARLYDEHLGDAWRRAPEEEGSWAGARRIPDEELWAAREDQRAELVRFVRRARGASEGSKSDLPGLGSVLDPRVLTIGFARRFASYKRGTLMLSDRDRLRAILLHPERPVQIVVAGKAHPRDDAGKSLIQELVRFSQEPDVRARFVFLEDYDMRVARRMVQGVDVWLNNPRRPLEASGTSGMKVVPNGGLNLSILDGWWDEGYDPAIGWAIGDRAPAPDHGQQDWLDSKALYDLIEGSVAPLFYHRIEGGLPRGWVGMMRRSIVRLASRFSTARMVRDYTDRFYLPAAAAYEKMGGNGLDAAREAIAWRDRVKAAWSEVRIVSAHDDAPTGNALGASFRVEAEVALGALTPEDVSVEVVTGRVGPNRELVSTRTVPMAALGRGDPVRFSAEITFDQPGHQGYCLRIVPRHGDVDVTNELGLVLWQG